MCNTAHLPLSLGLKVSRSRLARTPAASENVELGICPLGTRLVSRTQRMMQLQGYGMGSGVRS